jgi:hypothetical protein
VALHVQRLQIVAINLSHAIKPNILVGVAEYPKLAFISIIQMCSISLVAQNESVHLWFKRSGGRILDLTAEVAFESFTLASLTDRHASVEALNFVDEVANVIAV